MTPLLNPANGSINFQFATNLKTTGSGKGAPAYDARFTMDDATLLAKITPMTTLGTIDNQNQRFSKTRTFASQYILKTLKEQYPCVGTERLDVHIEFSRQGNPTRIQITGAGKPCFQKAVVEIVSRLQWTSIDGHRAVTVQLNINQTSTGNPNENTFVSMADDPASQLDETTRKAIQQLNQVQAQRIEETRIRNFARDAMHATDLGWINLDDANSGKYVARLCYANCDQSTIAPVLNVNDFSCFLNKYAANDPQANCDRSTIAPILNVNDFSCFLNKFAAGCP